MTQLRRHSLAETVCSTAIGYGVAVATQAVVLPWFGIHLSGGEDAEMAAIFTVVSLARGYAVRRAAENLPRWIGAYRDWQYRRRAMRRVLRALDGFERTHCP